MLHQHLYTTEKLREIESQRMTYVHAITKAPRKPTLAPLARPLGRALHGLGHRLETWATTPADRDSSGLGMSGRAR